MLLDKMVNVQDKTESVSEKQYRQVGRPKVRIESWGGSVRYQICLIFYQSVKTIRETTPYPVNIDPNLQKFIVTDKKASVRK